MTDVKKPWDENIGIEADMPGGGGAGEAAAKLGQVAVIGEQPGGVGGIGGAIGGGSGSGGLDIGQHVTGIAGGTLSGGLGGAAGGAAGGGLPGGVTGIVAEGGVPDLSKIGSGVGMKVGEEVAKAVDKAIKGPLGGVVGAVAGGISAAVTEGVLGLAKGGVPKANIAADLPEFEEKAITSAIPKSMQGAVDKAKGVISKGLGAIGLSPKGKNLEVEIASGDKLDVRQFSVHERLSALFQVNLIVVSENPSIEFDDVVGQSAKFTMAAGMHERFWSGICNHFEQVKVEPTGLSTYQLSIVPALWLTTQRKNYRMFQQISEPDIVQKMLKEWGIDPVVRIDTGAYKKRKYRVQYAESDFAFISRMLEDAGITFYFEQEGGETKLVLSDAPQSNPKRGAPLKFVDDTSMVRSIEHEYVTGVRMGQRVRPGKYTIRDHDYRKPPNYKLMKTASKGLSVEEKLERFQYAPGAFLFGADSGEATPVADDKGKTRTDEKEGESLAQRRLDAKRGSARIATFETNGHDLAPGVVMSMGGHPHSALGDGKSLLVVESSLSGTDRGEWSHYCEARGTEVPFRPDLVTPRPTVNGVESATVVGPAGEEIHTDEFGRVRVHFHWDRESKMDDNSSCWIHVSQPWGGSGYGGSNLPRVGQEVLVDFLGGDPDRPVIVGRVFTNLQKTPYKLPDNKTQSGWKSMSSPGGEASNFNELMFEDKKGQELVRMQAEKDLTKLVKNNESVTIGQNRTKLVGANDSLTVGASRTKRVKFNEQSSIGMNKTLTVGINRATQVGAIDSTIVGNTHVVQISPPGEFTLSEGSTSLLMQDKHIRLDTGGGASIDMTGDTIRIVAKKIELDAEAKIELEADEKIELDADKLVDIRSKKEIKMIADEDTTIKGAMVKIN